MVQGYIFRKGSEMSGILINVDARADKAQRDLSQINDSLKNIQGSANKVTESLSGLVKGFASFAAGAGALAYVTKVSDEFANLNNQIKLVVGETSELGKVQSRLVSMSIKNRIELTATSKIYSTLGKSMANAADNTESLIAATEAIQKAVALSGSSAESSTAAIIQLGQGLASGTLRGEELNSVMEQTPRLAKAIADGMGVSLGQMRALAAEGKVTSSAVFGAILSQTQKLNKEFDQMTPTLMQALTALNTGTSAFTNELLQGFGVMGSISNSIMSFAKYLDEASISARAFGAVVGYEFSTIVNGIAAIGKPIVGVFTSIARQTIAAFPKVNFTRTLFGDFKEGLRQIDDLAGGAFTKVSHILRYGLYDLLTYDSAAESAIKKIKRLSPTRWLTGGMDSATINRFFSAKTIRDYGAAFVDLAKAVSDNPDSFFVKAGEQARNLQYALRSVIRYMGLTPDTLLTFRIGDVDAFNYSMTELLRGLTGVQLKFTEIGKLTKEVFNTSSMRLYLALDDIAMAIPSSIKGAIKAVFDYIVETAPKVAKTLKQMVKDFWLADIKLDQPDIKLPKLKLPDIKIPKFNMPKLELPSKSTFNEFVGALEKGIDKAKSFYTTMSKAFRGVKDTVVDTYESMADKISDAFDKARKAIKAFVNYEAPLEFMARKLTEYSSILYMVVGPGVLFASVLANIAAAADLAFNPSLARRLRDVLIDVIEWVSKFAPNVAAATAEFFGLNDELKEALGWSVMWLALGHHIEVFATMGAHAVSTMVDMVGKMSRISLPDQVLGGILTNMESRIDRFANFLSGVYQKVAKFGRDVIRVFFEIWDEVVGHSWWPDTIDGVVDYSANLTDRVMPAMDRFQKYINGVFSGLADGASNLNGRQFAINIKVRVVELKETLSGIISEINNEFPHLVRGIGFGIAAIVAAMILPMNAAFSLLITDLALSAISNLSIFAENLSENVFGESLSKNLGEKIGAAVAGYMISIVQALPGIVNLIASAAYGFAKAFIEGALKALPFGLGTIVGGITESLLRLIDIVGIGGPLGMVGLFLFGRSGLKVLANLGIFKDQINKLFEVSAAALKYTETGGVLSKLLFGASQKTILSGLAMALTLTGAFDSLFNGSLLAKAGTLGVIGMILFGGNPVKFAATAYTNAIAPLFSSINSAAASSSSLMVRLVAQMTSSKILIGSLIAAVLFFSSSMANANELSKDSIRDSSNTFDSLLDSVVALRDTLIQAAVANPMTAIFVGLSGAFMASHIARATANMLALKRKSAEVAGDIVKATRLDKAFAFGTAALVTLTTYFPVLGGAFAKMIDLIKLQWAKMALYMSVYWATFVTFLTDTWRAFALTSFGQALLGMWASFAAWAGKIKAELTILAARFKNLGAGAAIGGLAAGGALLGGGGLADAAMSAFAAVSAFEALGQMFPKAQAQIVSLLGWIGDAVAAAFAFSAILTVGVGLIVGGILGVMFFGEGDTFFEKLDDVWFRLKRITGLSNEVRNQTFENTKRNRELQANAGFVKDNDLGKLPSFSGIRFDIVSDREKKAVDSTFAKYNEAMEKAKDEYYELGVVTDETRQQIRKLGESLQAINDRLAAKAAVAIPEDVKSLDKQAQPQNNSWWPKVKAFFPDMFESMAESGTRRAMIYRRDLAKTPEEKAKVTAELKQFDDTAYRRRSSYVALAPQDEQLQRGIANLKRGSEIDPKLVKAFNKAYEGWKSQLIETMEVVNSSGYSDKDKFAARYKLAMRRKGMNRQLGIVQIAEEREGKVREFNKSLKDTSETLKEANVQFDDSILFNSDDSSWTKIKALTKTIKDADTSLREVRRQEGATGFVERIALERQKMEASAKLLLVAQQAFDKAYSSPQAAMSRLNDAIGLGFDKDAIAKIGKEAADEFVTQMQAIEQLKLNYKSDISVANMIFPEDTSDVVKKAIQKDDSKAVLLAYITDLEHQLKQKMASSFRIGDYLQQLTSDTGIQFSGSDLATDDMATVRARLAAAERIKAAQKEYDDKMAEYNALTPDQITPQIREKAVQAAAELARVQKDVNEQIRLATPELEGYNAKLDRMANLTGLSATELLRLPKSFAAAGKAASGASFDFIGDPRAIIQDFDDAIQSMEKKLGSYLPGSEQAIAMRKSLEDLKSVAAAYGQELQKSMNDIGSVSKRLQAAGLTFQPNEWFAIDPATITGLDALAKKIADLGREMSDPSLSVGNFQEKSKLLAQAMAEMKNKEEAARADISARSFQFQSSTSKMAAANNSFGTSFDRTIYFANKAIIDEATQQLLEMQASFLKLSEDLKIREAAIFDQAAAALKRKIEEISFNTNDASVNVVNLLSAANVSIDKAGANRLTTAQQDNFSAQAKAIRDAQVKADDPQLDNATRMKAQETVDILLYKLSESVKLATLRPDEKPIFQAANTFANSMTDAFTNGIKDVLNKKITVKEFLYNMVNTFAEGIVNAFVEGLLEPFTGKDGIVHNMLKQIGAGAFGMGTGAGGVIGGGRGDEVKEYDDKIKPYFDSFTAATGEMFSSLSSSVSGFFSTASTGVTDLLSGLANSLGEMGGSLMDTVGTMFSSFSDGFSSMFESLGSAIGDIASAIMSMFLSIGSGGGGSGGGGGGGGLGEFFSLFLAEGGHVSGPGTATSDSIPAMLSNGEFVVNAKATRKYGNLLHAINSGQIPQFAEGGAVNSMSTSRNIAGTLTKNSANSAPQTQQTFNIDITGDVSRQTRAEIQRMIPQIAGGVGAYNREKGRR